jgi:hypothetical protein
MDRKKVIGTAAGAAAAVTAVGVAAAKYRNRKPTVLHVRQKEDAWIVEADGGKPAASRHDTKREAVKAARASATSAAPSQLVIHRRDGSVQKQHTYERE